MNCIQISISISRQIHDVSRLMIGLQGSIMSTLLGYHGEGWGIKKENGRQEGLKMNQRGSTRPSRFTSSRLCNALHPVLQCVESIWFLIHFLIASSVGLLPSSIMLLAYPGYSHLSLFTNPITSPPTRWALLKENTLWGFGVVMVTLLCILE